MKLRWMFVVALASVCVECVVAGDLQLLNPGAQAMIDSCKRAYACDDFDAAVDFAKEAIELAPKSSVCQLWLGIAYSEKTESGFFVNRLLNARKCKGAFERAVELAPNSLDAREGLIEYHVRAPGVAGGSAETAWEHADFIMQSDSVRGHLAAAYIHERKEQDTIAAERAFLDAVAADTSDITAQLRLAGFYARHESFHQAESVLVAAAKSGNREALLNLGWFCSCHAKTDEASGAFETLLAADPQDVDALFYLTELRALSVNDQGRYGTGPSFESIAGECAEMKFLSGVREQVSAELPESSVAALKHYLDAVPCLVYRPCCAYPHLLTGIESYRPGRARAHFRLALTYQRLPHMSRESSKELQQALELDDTFWPAHEMAEDHEKN